jgi:hypothetical protein
VVGGRRRSIAVEGGRLRSGAVGGHGLRRQWRSEELVGGSGQWWWCSVERGAWKNIKRSHVVFCSHFDCLQ